MCFGLAVLGSHRCGALVYCRTIFICSYNNNKYRTVIRKMPNKNVWKLYSKKGDVLGTFRSKKKAEERERQINYFKSRNK